MAFLQTRWSALSKPAPPKLAALTVVYPFVMS